MSRFDKTDAMFGLVASTNHDKPMVRLAEGDNALSIIGDIRAECRRQKFSNDWFEGFKKEALSGDYEHLLGTVRRFCHVID